MREPHALFVCGATDRGGVMSGRLGTSHEPGVLRCGSYVFDSSRPRVMGILNVTPDSFSDGGRFVDLERAIDHGHAMREQGADIIDVGGESTRPGASEISSDVELERVLPVVRRLANAGIAVSVDTSKPEVMCAAIAAGAVMINDVRALVGQGALQAVVHSEVGVCLMHMQGDPRTMQDNPQYSDVAGEVRTFLLERAQACIDAGIARERIAIDPGFGFGKTLAHNLVLMQSLPELVATGFQVVVGWSRKGSLGTLTGRAAPERLAASLAAALAAVARGAQWLRVHDVRETIDALAVWRAIEEGSTTTMSPRRS